MTYSKEIFVHFDEADPAGILYFANVFSFTHRLIEEMLAEAPFGWDGWFKIKNGGAPLRHVEAEFLNPLLPGNKYLGSVDVKKVSDSTAHFTTTFSQAGTIHAVVQTTHVFVKKEATVVEKANMPIEIKEFLQSKISS
jgi:acyl-CoA thioester hydrolase/1,4-dihydroxy-2-naphthoyl-CoA hydrolase